MSRASCGFFLCKDAAGKWIVQTDSTGRRKTRRFAAGKGAALRLRAALAGLGIAGLDGKQLRRMVA